jgi:3-isopropylmalate/(R)-2-methylmalate dehydratase small subunit
MKPNGIRGKALVLGNGIDSENLHPATYFSLDLNRVAEGFLAGFPSEIRRHIGGDLVIVAGTNFGVGSSREVVVQAFVLNHVQAIVAVSFNRIFFRNAINNGLPVFELANATRIASTGDDIEVDLDEFRLLNHTTSTRHALERPNDLYLEMLRKGRIARDKWLRGRQVGTPMA